MMTILQLLIPCILYATVNSQILTCKSGLKLRKVGCYGDFKAPSSKRAMPELLLTDRDKTSKKYSGQSIDWKNWNTYLPDFSCRCAMTAKDKGYDYIGVQYYGECWSSSDAINRYNLYGPRDNCVTTLFTPGNTAFEICSDNDSLACTGALFSNYVYEIVKAIDGNFTPWVEECCSQTCGGGVKKWKRTCTNPSPQYGGKSCEGPTEKTEICDAGPCDSYSSTEGSATGVAV